MQPLVVANCYNSKFVKMLVIEYTEVSQLYEKTTVHKGIIVPLLPYAVLITWTLCSTMQPKYNMSHSYTHFSRTDAIRNRLQ